jgi:hypothetical protein
MVGGLSSPWGEGGGRQQEQAGKAWAFLMPQTLTGDSPSTRGPLPTRRAPLRPFRSTETLVQVLRAMGSLLLQGGTMSRLWMNSACPGPQ